MTDRKKALVIVATLVSMLGLLMFIGNLAGCGPHRFAGKDDDSWSDRRHRFFKCRSAGFQERIEKHVDEKVAELKLSASQQAHYEALKEKFKTRFQQGLDDRKTFMAEVTAEMNKPRPDLNTVSALTKEKLHTFPDRVEGYMDLIMSFYNTLDEKQQARIVEKIREKMKWHRKHFGAIDTGRQPHHGS